MKRHITLIVVLLSLLAGFALWRAARTQAAPFATLRVPEDHATIQAAINAAQAGDTVDVRAGTYNGAGNRELTVNKAITIKCRTGTGDDCIVEDGRGLAARTIVTFSTPNVTPVLDGFTLRAGTGFGFIAGGMYIYNGAQPLIRNCKITGNNAINENGGVLVENAFPEFRNCAISGNLGTGMKVTGVSIAALSDCTLSNNTSDGLKVGASTLGLFNEASGKPTALISNCRFENNTQSGLEVASIVPDSEPSAIVTGSVFSGNGQSGVDAFNADTLSLTNCALLFNTGIAPNAGGLNLLLARQFALTNSLVVGNRVIPRVAQPGVLDSPASAVALTFPRAAAVTNCTITSHNSPTLPTMYFVPALDTSLVNVPFRVTNTIFWGNTATTDIIGVNTPGYPAVTVSACDSQRGTMDVADGGGNLNVDPLFVRNALTNGATDAGDLRLQNTSPVINRGTTAGLDLNIFPKNVNNTPLDYAGNPRVFCAGQIDQGAYENQSTPSGGQLVFGQQPNGTTPNTPLSPTVTVRLVDACGTLMNSNAAVTLTLNNANGATLSGGSVNAVGGSATFNNLAVSKSGIGYTLTAASGALTGATSNAFDIACPNITIGTPASAMLGVLYSSSIAATPAAPSGQSYQYSLANNTSLPSGLILVSNAAGIGGIPAVSGNFSFDLKAELFNGNVSTGCSVTQTRTINVTCVSNPMVTNRNDSGAGSLREAIATACAGSTISFADGLTGTLSLTSDELKIERSLTIQGPGANLLNVQRGSGTPNIRIFHITAGDVTLAGLTMSNGQATPDRNGGGVLNEGTGTVTVTRSTLSGNSADYGGGGIANFSTGAVTVTYSTLSGNSATSVGGGIYNANLGTITVVNSTLTGNTSTVNGGQGGGLYNGNGLGGTVTLTNCTVAGNTANRAGGIYNQGADLVRLRNTLVAANTATTAPDAFGGLTSLGNNLLGKSDGSTGLTNNVNNDKVGTLAAPLDPLLAAPGNYGGPTQTQRPLPGSPAINAGDNCVFDNTCSPNPLGFNLTSDQRGATFSRKVGGTMDIGAVETSYALAATGGTPQSTVVNTNFTNPLVATLTESGQPVSGVSITFTAQAANNGASASFTGSNPATTNASGQASVNVAANAFTGSYSVTANTTPGLATAASFTLTNTCPMITVNAPATTTGTAGFAFNQMFTQTGGVGAPTFSLQSGTLPQGLTLAGNGVLSGTPVQTGTFPLTVKATDANNCTGLSAPYNLVIGCPTLTLSALPAATAGTLFTANLNASPAGGNYQFSSADKPAWLTLAANGALTGTPPTAGPVNFTLGVTGFGGACGQSFNVTLVVNCPSLMLAPATLPNAAINTAYPTMLSATPAGGNYSFVVTSGLLPAGLALNGNGSFSGAPTQSGVFNFRVTATGFGACGSFRDYVLTVECPGVSLNPASLPGGMVGAAYNQSIAASPAGAYSYNVTSGALPVGLTLNAATGALTGTPAQAGTFSFTLAAAAGACAASRSYTVTMGCAGITLGALANATVGTSYAGSVAASPSGAYTYALVTGGLPVGLMLNATTGALTGTPSSTGTFNFTLKAQTANGCGGQQSYALVVGCPTIALSALATPTLNTAYNQTISATPAGGNYVYAVSSGALPAGLALNAATGALTGTPTAAGAYSFTLTATGFGTCTGSRTYSGVIASTCPTITLSALPNGQPGQLYSQVVTGSPSATYSYAVTAGSVPPGLTFIAAGGLLYGYPTAAGTYNFTITATDANNCTGARAYTLSIGSGAAALAMQADYDGDGKADPALWAAQECLWRISKSSTQQAEQQSWGMAGDVTLLGDYDGDGKSDLAVFRPSNATFYVKRSSDGGYLIKQWGLSTDVPVPGDYDGDGKTDIAVWRGSNGTWYVLRSADQQPEVTAWGAGYAPYHDVPVPGNYDGDGKTDLAVFRRATGTWLIKRSSDGQFTIKQWGVGTDVPVPGDYDGDGKTDITVWRGAEGNWYVLRSSDQRAQVSAWGSTAVGDAPAPGDYDGDGQADLTVWRGPTGAWYVRESRTQTVRTQSLGQSGDRLIGQPAR
ncbi:MAG: putative Ig domain-containing protein [Acidobacteria bacterium]|nr:putative Ig domain-containing protein [Acidobacteriota bacterium]